MMLSPTGTLDVRGPDAVAHSGGHFGASRIRASGKVYKHKGTDLVASPWSVVFCPGTFKVKRVGIAYGGDLRYHSLVLINGLWIIKLLYVWPFYQAGELLVRGQAIGVVEDLTKRYPKVINHLHAQARRKSSQYFVDLLPHLEAV